MLLTTILCEILCHQLDIFLCDITTELHVDYEIHYQLWISFLGLNQLCKSSADLERGMIPVCEVVSCKD